MSDHSDDFAEEDAVIRQMQRVVGYVPLGVRDLLRCLTHPDVWPLMSAYGEAKVASFSDSQEAPDGR